MSTEGTQTAIKRLTGLRELCGYIEDGSHDTLVIGQDDATKEWVLTLGHQSCTTRTRHYYGATFEAVIDAAMKAEHTPVVMK